MLFLPAASLGWRISTVPEFGTRGAFTIEAGPEDRAWDVPWIAMEQQSVFCAVEGDPARKFIAHCCDGDIVTVKGFHETRPSTAAANTPWTGRFRVRAVYTAPDFLLIAQSSRDGVKVGEGNSIGYRAMTARQMRLRGSQTATALNFGFTKPSLWRKLASGPRSQGDGGPPAPAPDGWSARRGLFAGDFRRKSTLDQVRGPKAVSNMGHDRSEHQARRVLDPRKASDLDALVPNSGAQLRRDRVRNLKIPMTYRGQEGEVGGAGVPPIRPVWQTLRLP
jgi:hypothetical protein